MAISDEIAVQMPLANAQVMIAEHPANARPKATLNGAQFGLLFGPKRPPQQVGQGVVHYIF